MGLEIGDIAESCRCPRVGLQACQSLTLACMQKRHSADADVNRRKVRVFKSVTFETIQWTQVRVGDIVKVINNHYFPADMLLLASSEPDVGRRFGGGWVPPGMLTNMHAGNVLRGNCQPGRRNQPQDPPR